MEVDMLDVALPGDLEERLTGLAKLEGRSASDVVATAVRDYVERYDQALRAEARRQSQNAAERGWTEEDHYWESRSAFDNAEPPSIANAAE
jgi:predicted transcriptional regulator